jgi:hypothetical protein
VVAQQGVTVLAARARVARTAGRTDTSGRRTLA